MTDLTPYKIAIFEGINDLPTAPTVSSGQNISYNNAKHNDLVDALQATIDDLTARITAIENESAEVDNTPLPNSSDSESLSFFIEGPSGSSYLAEVTGGMLAYYFVEGASVNSNIYLSTEVDGIPFGVSNKIERDNGIYYIPDTDGYPIDSLSNLYLQYDNVDGELSSIVRVFYQ